MIVDHRLAALLRRNDAGNNKNQARIEEICELDRKVGAIALAQQRGGGAVGTERRRELQDRCWRPVARAPYEPVPRPSVPERSTARRNAARRTAAQATEFIPCPQGSL